MKHFLILFILVSFIITSLALEKPNIQISGETNYSSSEDEKFNNILKLKYTYKLYEPRHQKYIIYLSGVIIHDYDLFGNRTKASGLTAIGIDF